MSTGAGDRCRPLDFLKSCQSIKTQLEWGEDHSRILKLILKHEDRHPWPFWSSIYQKYKLCFCRHSLRFQRIIRMEKHWFCFSHQNPDSAEISKSAIIIDSSRHSDSVTSGFLPSIKAPDKIFLLLVNCLIETYRFRIRILLVRNFQNLLFLVIYLNNLTHVCLKLPAWFVTSKSWRIGLNF